MVIEDKLNEIKRLPSYKRNPNGFMRFGRIPYKIYRALKCSGDDIVSEKNPACYRITSDSHGGEESLSVWIYKGVPEDFRNILFYHELKEAEFKFSDGLSREESHKRAVSFHIAYAKKFLPEDKFNEFLEWQSKYMYNDESFFGVY